MSTDKAPAEKLPLAIRKNIRDGWENKKSDLEGQVSELLGTPWTFEVNPNAIYPYAAEGSYGNHSLGDCINAYFEGFIYGLKYFLQYHGDTGKDEINNVAPTHIVTIGPSTKFSYCGTEVKDGKLVIVFQPDNLATNINDVAQKLEETLSTAPQPDGGPVLNYSARHSINADYTSSIDEILEKVRKLLQSPTFSFEPDFEALGAKLASAKNVGDGWQTNFGTAAKNYFESFYSALDYEKFGDDDMLREGLEEGAPKGVVRLRIVDKLQTEQNGYNEIVIDDGAVVIQTTPANWGVNIYNSASKIVDIL